MKSTFSPGRLLFLLLVVIAVVVECAGTKRVSSKGFQAPPTVPTTKNKYSLTFPSWESVLWILAGLWVAVVPSLWLLIYVSTNLYMLLSGPVNLKVC